MVLKVFTERLSRRQSTPAFPPYRRGSSDTMSSCDSGNSSSFGFRRPSRRRQSSANKILVTRSATSARTLPTDVRKNPLLLAQVAALQKENMLDVTLQGRSNVQVKASKYVLSCRCAGLEELLALSSTNTVYVGDYSEVAIRGLVEYCFTGELQEFAKGSSCVEAIVELAHLADAFEFRTLQREVYQLSRRNMNSEPNMACVFYNMCESAAVRDMALYAVQTISACPNQVNRVACLRVERLQSLVRELLQDEMEATELVKLLLLWVETQSCQDTAMQVARSCAQGIDLTQLSLMDESTMRLFDKDAIQQAQSQAGAATTPTSLPAVEHVVVQGAGNPEVNGVYYRRHEEDEEPLYIKCDDPTEFGLHMWNNTWHIAASHDLSHSHYTCAAAADNDKIVPSCGWQSTASASDPPPQCTWMPPREQGASPGETRKSAIFPACFASEEDLYGN